MEKYAQVRPPWGHRKIHALLRADGPDVSVSTVERAMRRRNLVQPVEYAVQRRELAKARKAAFADPPTRANRVWQLGSQRSVRFSRPAHRVPATPRLSGRRVYGAFRDGWDRARRVSHDWHCDVFRGQ